MKERCPELVLCNLNMEKEKQDAAKIIEQILGQGIDWFDYKKSDDKNFWRTYFNEAKYIARSEVFNNEVNHYVADIMKFITYKSENFDQVLHLRTSIVTLETLKQRLESIEDPTEVVINKEPFNAL